MFPFQVVSTSQIINELHRLIRSTCTTTKRNDNYRRNNTRIFFTSNLQTQRDRGGASKLSFFRDLSVRFTMTLRNVTRDVTILNGDEEIGGCRIMLITRTIGMFRNVFYVNNVTNIAQRIRFSILINRISNFNKTIRKVRRFNISARDVCKRTTNVTRRVRCTTTFNVAFR